MASPGASGDVQSPEDAQSPGLSDNGALGLDEEAALKNLTENVRDQDDLERDITYQANLALIEAEDKKDHKRIEKARANKEKLRGQIRVQEQKLRGAFNNPNAKLRIEKEIARIEAEMELADKDISDCQSRIEQRHQEGTGDVLSPGAGHQRLPNESHREFLIRTGKITPFAKIGGPRPHDVDSELANAILDAEDEAVAERLEEQGAGDGPRSHQNLRLPGFAEDVDGAPSAAQSEISLRPRKKRKIDDGAGPDDDFRPPSEVATPGSTGQDGESDGLDMTVPRRKKTAKASGGAGDKVDFSRIDDGNEAVYQRRLADWVERRSTARRRREEQDGLVATSGGDGEEEWFKPSPDHPDHTFDNGLKLPSDIYPSLFDYQKTGVQWLAELYEQKVGGIVGDEMGLGKTGKASDARPPVEAAVG